MAVVCLLGKQFLPDVTRCLLWLRLALLRFALSSPACVLGEHAENLA